jgi:hypothetical protein
LICTGQRMVDFWVWSGIREEAHRSISSA